MSETEEDTERGDGGDTREAETVVSVNPATGDVNEEVVATTPEEVDEAVEAAREAQRSWEARSVNDRLRVLDVFQNHLIRRRDEVARTIAAETGKPVGEGLVTDLIPVIDAVRFLKKRGPEVMETGLDLDNIMVMDRKSKIVREPLGVLGMVTPWNYPFGIPGSQVVYALFAGNAVVLKPARETTLTGLKIEEILNDAGLPDDLLHVVPGGGSTVGQAIVESDIDQMTFTGSNAVGEMIQERCQERGVPTTMELGGSDPAVVLEDANIDKATSGIVWSRFMNCGQTCAAVKRAYAHDSVFDEFRDEIVRKVDKLRVGNGAEENVDVGPLIDEGAVDELAQQVDDSVEMGAEVLTGGERLDREGSFYAPTVLGNVTHEMPVVREETFGPVIPVMGFEDISEGIEKANDTRFGLTASVWTRDTDRGERVAREIDAGTVVVNDHGYTYGINETPWGGYKDSGHGRTHGVWGIEEVTRMKHINKGSADTVPRSLRPETTWWFPYSDDYLETMGDGIEFLYGNSVVRRARKAPKMLKELIGKKGL
ncbi:aldehyde dehydrogenase family protein [Haladaptatus sp. F3-133]|uniref:Aldehyde dehydrogenase family protein n=1 Tax=Halorutilus salinus TaxID=2487751 RepID=A0A9Q4C5A8_9EURY|nr:aldehyde dehydrogenase family protein [Halorutilus salinus]MCX2819209.1 aldehyde dehydrogenase family protein [Halorutilus salinus]